MAPMMEDMHTAMINRSIRTIKAELEYLCDASVITPQTLSELLTRIPEQTALHAPLSVGAVPTPHPVPGAPQPPTTPLANLNLHHNAAPAHEKQQDYYQPPSHNPPPPAYSSPPPLAHATALYAYTSTDAGDLILQPHDRIAVTEYLNAEWWKGRSARTGLEGIFPRSYVQVVEDKTPAPAPAPATTDYGNQPLQVSGMGDGAGKIPGKGQEMGKKFGKKLGNAAIFGAGATIGGNIVNSIL